MTREIEPQHHASLRDYEGVAHLARAVRELRHEAEALLPRMRGRRVWMVNSTAQGGGVAELLPPLVGLLRELDFDARWLVMESEDPSFFRLTKRLHNMIHGEGSADLAADERSLYERCGRLAADEIGGQVADGDLLIVHDPQPLAAGAALRRERDIAAVWRCHIGLDRENPATVAAWDFLEPWARAYDHAVFTAAEYIPRCLSGKASVLYPSIDPLSDKNRELPVHRLTAILAGGGLVRAGAPVADPPFSAVAQRLQADGSWAVATEPDDIGLLFRPIVCQVSRWDRLKGYLPLLQGFAALKRRIGDDAPRTLQLARLVLAGPDPAFIADDPEGREALDELCAAYRGLAPALQEDVAVLTLPMESREENALLVNALQRCSDVVVQNSLREGFGLTATEAMWKRIAVVGSSAVGLRQQIRDGLDGCLVRNPQDPEEIARTLGALLADPVRREALGLSAQQRVHDDFLIFAHLRRWLKVMGDTVASRWD